MQSSSEPLKIGGLARAANVGIETIRYYQRRRLLGQPPRPVSGQRVYSADYVDRVRFIKRAQTLGFSLEEIAALLKLDRGTGHMRAREVAGARLADIEAKIADLTAMHRTLSELVRHCEHSHGKVACPIIATLSSDQQHAEGGRNTTTQLRTKKRS